MAGGAWVGGLAEERWKWCLGGEENWVLKVDENLGINWFVLRLN